MLQTNVKGPLTIAGIVVGLSLVLGLGGSYLLARALGAKAQAVSDARVASARAATLGPRIVELKSQEESANAYERVLALLMPTQEQLLEVPRSIEQLGRSHQVEARFQFLGSPGSGAAKAGASLPFSLSGTGSAANVASFVEDLELRNPRYTIGINSLEVTLSATDSDSRLSVSGDVYYQ